MYAFNVKNKLIFFLIFLIPLVAKFNNFYFILFIYLNLNCIKFV